MICKDCQRAADQPPLTFEIETFRRFIHPTDCGCDCQHKPVKEGQINK